MANTRLDQHLQDGCHLLGIVYPWAIGHLCIEFASFLKERQLGRHKTNCFAIACDSRGFANSHLVKSYFSEHANVFEAQNEIEEIYSKAKDLDLFIDCQRYAADDSGIATSYKIFAETQNLPPLFEVSNTDRLMLHDTLRLEGYDPSDMLLTVSIRAPFGRPQDSSHRWRNSSFTPVMAALEYARCRLDGRVNFVLTGDNIYPKELPKWIWNYPASKYKCEQLDISILGSTDLHFGTNSGILCVPSIFGRQVAIHDALPYGMGLFGSKDLIIFKSIFDCSTNRNLNPDEIFLSIFSSQSLIISDLNERYRIVDNNAVDLVNLMDSALSIRNDNDLLKDARECTSRLLKSAPETVYGKGSISNVCPKWFKLQMSTIGDDFLPKTIYQPIPSYSTENNSRPLEPISQKAFYLTLTDRDMNTDHTRLVVSISTEHPVAYDSPDHIQPWGTARDNSTNYGFNNKLLFWIPRGSLSVLDLGCSGGGFVKSLIDSNVFAVGIEGSDYSKLRLRAEWATIPSNLFTADVTFPFQLSVRDISTGSSSNAKFSVITSWEMIEHISEKDLPAVFDNIDRHLAPSGVVIMSISPNDDIINGVNLHQCVHDKAWWIDKLLSMGWKNHPQLVLFFEQDWVRSEPNAPGSFHVCLTRVSEEPIFGARAHINSFVFAKHGAPSGAISKLLGDSYSFKSDPVVVCDCGVRGGFETIWSGYRHYLYQVGIDVDNEAITEIDRQFDEPNAVALITQPVGATRFRSVFRRTRNKVSSSFLPTNIEFVSRFPQSIVGEVLSEEILEIIPLKDQLDLLKIPRLDYLKLDLEGYELEALKGLKGLERSILCISIEVFFQPYRHGSPTFGEVEDYLRPLGFALFDLKLERWNRLGVSDPNDSLTWYGHSGQVMWGQAIFLRDPILSNHSMDTKSVAKLAFIADVLGFKDYALELVSKFDLLRFA